jgi:outer membrane murein-binding lipoprotein Lpp
MSLLEVVVSSVVLAGSSSAALGVWNQAATEVQRATQLDELALQLETARIATHRWLQSDAAASVVIDPSSADCRFNPEALEAAVAERLPLGSEVSSRWSVDPQGLGHWLELSTQPQRSMPPLKRRLLLTPAAYGLCQQEEVRS